MMPEKTSVLLFVGGVALTPSSALRAQILAQARELFAGETPHRPSPPVVRSLPSDHPLRDEDSGQCGREDDA